MERELGRLRSEISTTTELAAKASAASAAAAATAAAHERSDAELDATRRQNHMLERETTELRTALTRLSATSPVWGRGWEHAVREASRSPSSYLSPERPHTSNIPPSPAYSFATALPLPAYTDAAKLLDTRLEELRRFVASPSSPSRT